MQTHEPDPNLTAACTASQIVANKKPLPAELEAAWNMWSKSIKDVDQRGLTQMRAAFEEGWASGAKSFAQKGGRAGGKARAESLNAKERKDIAKKAARKRWTGED